MLKAIDKAMQEMFIKQESYRYEKGYLIILYKKKEFSIALYEQLIMHSNLAPYEAIIKLVEARFNNYDKHMKD